LELFDFHNPNKIFVHLDRVKELRDRGDTTPIHLTIGLVNFCNHKCMWCYIEWAQSGKGKNTKPHIMDPSVLIETLKEAKDMGLKAITIVGDGEPTLHPNFAKILDEIKKINLDVGIFTNMSVQNAEKLYAMLRNCFFIRCSVDAFSKEMHCITHGVEDFDRVIGNILKLVKARREEKYPIIGVQFAANEINSKEIPHAAEFFRDLGVDYINYKPVYKNSLNMNQKRNKLSYQEAYELLMAAKDWETETFKVYTKFCQFKEVLENKYNQGRFYQVCYATALSVYLDEDGNVEICGNLKGRGFSIGNIYQDCFQNIWKSERRKKCIDKINLDKCPAGCKLNPLNIVLWNTFHPDVGRVHPNFI
jgi:cyclic pyranopterin phosphate synthase